jgi:hypothetical protein
MGHGWIEYEVMDTVVNMKVKGSATRPFYFKTVSIKRFSVNK